MAAAHAHPQRRLHVVDHLRDDVVAADARQRRNAAVGGNAHDAARLVRTSTRRSRVGPAWPSARYSVPPATAKRCTAPSCGVATSPHATSSPSWLRPTAAGAAPCRVARWRSSAPRSRRRRRTARRARRPAPWPDGARRPRRSHPPAFRYSETSPPRPFSTSASTLRPSRAPSRRTRARRGRPAPSSTRSCAGRRTQPVEHHLHRLAPPPGAAYCVKNSPLPFVLQATSPRPSADVTRAICVGQGLARAQVDHAHRVAVGAAAGQRDRHATSVRRRAEEVDRERAVRRPLARDRTPRARWPGRPPISGSPAPDAAAAARSSARRARRRVPPGRVRVRGRPDQRLQPPAQGRARGHRVEIAPGIPLLGLEP
jgi:hypothetical protein